MSILAFLVRLLMKREGADPAVTIDQSERLNMKFICLGYADHSKFASMSEQEMQRVMEECLAYDDVLREGGHFAGGNGLQDAAHAVTLRVRGGEVQVTDGPYAETKEQIGGILILEADNMEHAIELMSKHPGVRVGPFEIRPADEAIDKMVAERDAAFIEKRNKIHQE